MSEIDNRVRDYAMGNQDIEKYKRLLLAGRDGRKDWKEINWFPKNMVSKMRAKVIKPFRQSIKNHKMISRLKSMP